MRELDTILFASNLVRVGILAVAKTKDTLDGVGHSAWRESGGESIERALPEAQFGVLRLLTLHCGKREEIGAVLKDWCDTPNPDYRCHLILTVGGEGFGPNDLVPEATRDVIEREAPGLAERLRQLAIETASNSEEAETRRLAVAISRAVAGIRGATLIVNLPGCYENPAKAAEALLPLLPGAINSLNPEE